jgi:AraC-like DNA-binding protein
MSVSAGHIARRWPSLTTRQRARIAAAIQKLSTEANVSVKQLASDLGYASAPAFSHAFRQVTGKTPTAFSGKEVSRETRGRDRHPPRRRGMTGSAIARHPRLNVPDFTLNRM